MLLKLENEWKEEALGWYKRVRDLWPAMMAGQTEAEREWLLESEKLVEMFRSTRDLFSTGKVFKGMVGQRKRTRRKKVASDDEAEENDMASRLQADLGGWLELCNQPETLTIIRPGQSESACIERRRRADGVPRCLVR